MIHLSRTTPLASLILGVLILGETVSLSGQATRRRDIEIYNGRRAAAGEVLVRFRGAPTAQVLGALDLTESELVAGGVRRLRARRASVAQLLTTLRGRPDVVFVEPNYLIEPAVVPDDPYFPFELGLFNGPRPGTDIHAVDAWDAATGSRHGIIAILDSGIDRHHPDLADNLWSAPAPFTVTIGGRQIACPAGTHGFDAIALTCDPIDDHGHGTAMAGIIGAVGNNGIGVAGVNWSTSLMPVKFIDASGVGTYADAIRAIDFAMQVDEIFGAVGAGRVRVLSASWRGTGASQSLSDAVDRAASRDMLMVAAAGNDGADIDAAPVYPASLTSPNVLTVAATSIQDVREGYSNYGATAVDLAAPGATYTTARAGAYIASTGTSDAAALVAGTAALILSRCALSTPQLRALLLETVDVIEALHAMVATSGRLNAGRAVSTCGGSNAAPSVSIHRPGPRQAVSHTEPVVLEADAVDADGSVTSVDFYVGSTWVGRDTSSPFGIVTGLLPPGTYRLSAAATDDAGATTTSLPVWITVWSDAPLSSPWQFQDIGHTGTPGLASSLGTSSVVLAGSGADVWGTSDTFSYVYQPLHGDGEIVARVSALERVDRWTKGGVMLREGLSPGSRHAFVLVSGEKGVAFQRRHAEGGATLHTDGGPGAAPVWLKLARAGEVVTASSSADGTTWQLIATDTIAWGTDLYAGVAVTSHRAGELAVARFDGVALTGTGGGVGTATTRLPAGWLAADVGAVGAAGSAHIEQETFTVSGTGADIWGTSDAFHFVYTPLDGDGEILARVTALDGAAPWLKAGVMLRGSLDASSVHAFALLSKGHGAAYQRRTADGQLTTHTSGEAVTAPVWLRLIRHDDIVSAFTSSDGQEWTLIASDTVALGATALVGLAVSSHDITSPATAIFDSVAVWRPVPPPLPEAWRTTDIGWVPAAGASWDTGSGLTMTGSGADIWGTADAFHFAYTTLPDDGSITARVASLEHVHDWTKTGVMLRASLHPSSPPAFALTSGAKGLAFQRRLVEAGVTVHTAGPLSAAPQWLRLVRAGPTITALTSTDGVSWSVMASETFAISGPVYAGLALSSHDAQRSATAVFTDVRVTR